MRRPALILITLLAALAALSVLAAMPAAAQASRNAPRGPVPADAPLITDLSSHLIAITSNFTGTQLLLFGAIDEPGEVIVVVRGPATKVVVRRKRRILGFWLTRHSERFDSVPGYYAVISSAPLNEIAPEPLLQRLQIGANNLRFRYLGTKPPRDLASFREAVIRHKTREGLFNESIGGLEFLGPKLFRAEMDFPATVPVGTYRAEVYLIRDDRIIAAQSTPLFIDKQGIEQQIYDFSRQEPAVYGLVAVLLAVMVGWLAALAFRRG
ncbi:MAG TPA: TIGR02186 family protein [Ferrovibrio sp.]|uniref:TIGR02186 family protein n=1 Tax=Ferrovibrio sp. TaxID=1917215 RepID=UPI002ED4F3DC